MRKLVGRLAAGALCLIGTSASSPQMILQVEGSCVYDGSILPAGEVYGFLSDAEAEDAVKRIMDQTGLVQNFVIHAADVPNAAAAIYGENRMILYNQDFMIRVADRTNTDWAAVSIMAHEVGHHLQGHTIRAGGSRPLSELEADRYSGFVLFRMGATLDEAQAAMNALGSETGSVTHPPRSARIAAITNGWQAARDMAGAAADVTATPANASNTSQSQTGAGPVPVGGGQPSIPQAPAFQYVSRVNFVNDATVYMVTNANDIVALSPTGPVLIGRKIPPTLPGLAWMYQTAYVTYGVSFSGQVFGQYPNGTFFQVGLVTNP